MRAPWLCIVLLLVSGAPVAAGDVYHPDSNAAAGSLSGLPWVQQEVRYQALVPAGAFGAKSILITDLAFATGAVGTFTATQCEVSLAHLPATSRFGTNFAANLQKDGTVMFSGPITWPGALDQWSPLGLTGSFKYNGVDGVVVEVRFQNGQGGVKCRSGQVAVVFASGAGSYSTLQAGNIAPLLAPKMRLTYNETLLSLSGSPSPGGTVNLDLLSTGDAGRAYQLGSSFGTGPIPIDSRQLDLSPDALLVLSVSGVLPTVFENYAGVLDAQSQAKARIHIPAVPALKGVRIHSAFVTLLATAPSGVANISNMAMFTIL